MSRREEPASWDPWKACVAISLVAAAVFQGARPGDFIAAYLLAVSVSLLLHHAAGSGRDALLLAASLAFLSVAFGPAVAVTLAAASLLLLVVLRRAGGRTRGALLAAAGGAFCAGLPPLFAWLAGPGAAAPLQLWTCAFLFTTFMKRALWCCYDVCVAGFADWTAGDLLRYLLGMPNLLGLSATPSFAGFLAARDGGEATLRDGVRTTLICLGWAFVTRWPVVDPGWIFDPLLRPSGQPVATLWSAILALYAWTYATRLAHEQLTVGLWRMHGYAVGDDFKGALRASSPVDLWRRWNLLWRDFLMRVIFFPVALALGRRWGARSPWACAAAAMATFLGGFVFDAFPLAVCLGPVLGGDAAGLLEWLLIYHLAHGALVSVGLYGEMAGRAQGRRAALPRPWSTLVRAASIGATFVAASLLTVCHTWVLSAPQMREVLVRALLSR